MTLKEQILADMKSAMRDKDTARLETVRMLRSAIQRREVDERVELDDAGVVSVVQKMIKQGQDAAQQFEQGGRAELADKERAGIEVLESYLPAQLSDDEIQAAVEAAIAETGATSLKDMGKVMGLLKSRLQGQADMGNVSARIKAILA